MFRIFGATATLTMMLTPAVAQHLGGHAANPYVLGGASNASSRAAPTANSYTPPARQGSADAHQLPPYNPEVTNENRLVYSPDGSRNPYGAGNPYSPTATTNPYAKPRPDKD